MTTLADIVVAKTKDVLLSAALSVASSLGVPVTNWQVGEPSEALFQFVSEEIAALEQAFLGFCKSAFLDYAAADSTLYKWLVIKAEQDFGYIAKTATYATCTVLLTNSKGGIYQFDPGDITVKNSATGATYHNSSGGTLLGNSTLSLTFVADVAGPAGSSAAGAVDTMVTTYLGVTCASTTAAVGSDEETALSIVAGCRAKLGRMTNGGPRDAYVSVALDSSLTGTEVVTRARATGDSSTGVVNVLVAAQSGTVGTSDLTLVQSAIDEYATPLCVSAIVQSASPVVINIDYTVAAYKSWGVTASQVEALIQTSLADWVSSRPVGGDIIPPATTGTVAINMLEAAIRKVSDKIAYVKVNSPTSAVPIAMNQFPVLGAVTSSGGQWLEDP